MDRRDSTDPVEHLAPSEAARTRARDRKRVTRMVVDNAGVRRLLLERAARTRARPRPSGPERP